MLSYGFFESESLENINDKIFFSVSLKPDKDQTLMDFIVAMHSFSEQKSMQAYSIEYIKNPIFRLRHAFFEYIAQNGFGSLLKLDTALDDILSPMMSVDEVFFVFHKFVQTLTPAKNLLIIDPYFYAESGLTQAASTFTRLVSPILDQIENITVIYEKGNKASQNFIKAELEKTANRTINFNNIKSSKFHDRFWINSDTKNGIVIGTSLNGIRKKISLIDKLSANDVNEILKIAM